ncbi:hypothetical protein TEA_006751 [Camellia sinensis var. sinensis]|uniref:Uncharacterized protein n=1 Tax=Camellia sinensis var. sinensis TaxID=542762 RepID=A0A4S4DNZ8_CAMSN|nr:hypothetical protein TEA_006751 [Camellia sinensis var. sinensis]
MRSNPCVGILDCIKSPDVSVNSPRIDRMVEFPLASYEDSVIPIRRISSTSAQGSSTSPQGDQSIMKDKCTVQAAELLRHQHLQPYVLKVHLKLNSPRRNSLPTHWPQADYIKKTRFVEPEDIPVSTYKEKWHSFGNNRTLNPNITGPERDSSFSQRNQSTPSYLNKKIAELSVECIHEESDFGRKIISKASSFAMTPRLTPTKDSPTPKKRAELSKNRVSFPASQKPEKKSVHANRRASLPLPMRSNPCVGILDCIKSPDVSVNSRIDGMVEFPLSSYEDSVIPI